MCIIGEQHAARIDWPSARVYDKADGTLCFMYHYNNEWHIGTCGSPAAAGTVRSSLPELLRKKGAQGHDGHHGDDDNDNDNDDDHDNDDNDDDNDDGKVNVKVGVDEQGTFADLFWKIFKSSSYTLPIVSETTSKETSELPSSSSSSSRASEWTFIFEMVSPYNRIVVRYRDSQLLLLGARHKLTGREITARDTIAMLGPTCTWSPVLEWTLPSSHIGNVTSSSPTPSPVTTLSTKKVDTDSDSDSDDEVPVKKTPAKKLNKRDKKKLKKQSVFKQIKSRHHDDSDDTDTHDDDKDSDEEEDKKPSKSETESVATTSSSSSRGGGWTIELLQSLISRRHPLQCEGAVVVDGEWRRVKVKHPGFVAIHHLGNGSNVRNLAQIVRTGEAKEFIVYFPHWQSLLEPMILSYNTLISELTASWNRANKSATPKVLAIIISDLPCDIDDDDC
jgi:hypothetical protein